MKVYNNVWQTRFSVFERTQKNKVSLYAIGIDGKRLTKWVYDVLAVDNNYFFTDDGEKVTLYYFDTKVSKVRDIKDVIYVDREKAVYIIRNNNDIEVYSFPDILIHSIEYNLEDIKEPSISLLRDNIIRISGKSGEHYTKRLLLIEDNKIKSTLDTNMFILDIIVQGDFIVLRSFYFLEIYDLELKHLKTIYGYVRPFLESHGWDIESNNMEGVISKALSIEGKEIDVRTLV